MYPWGNPPATQAAAAYAVGDTVYSGNCAGTVASVDAEQATMGIVWNDGTDPITYPLDAPYLRKKLPWE